MGWLLSLATALPNLISKGFDYLNKKQDVDLEKYKVDGKIDEARLQAAMNVWGQMQDRGDRAMRWVFAYPLGGWWIIALVNTAGKDLFGWEWQVHSFPLLEQWGWAIVAFLFLASVKR